MSYTFIQAKSIGVGNLIGNTSVLTLGAQVGAGNFLAGCVTFDIGAATPESISSITDNGTGGTWVQKRKTDDTTNGQTLVDIYGYGWSVTPTTVTVTFNPGSGVDTVSRGISLMEFSGQLSGNPIDGTNEQAQVQATPGTGANGAKSGAGDLTPAANNYLIVGTGVRTAAYSAAGATEFTAGTNFTKPPNAEWQITGDISFACEYWIQTTATAINASFTVTNNDAHITGMMIFKVAAGAPVGPFNWEEMPRPEMIKQVLVPVVM